MISDVGAERNSSLIPLVGRRLYGVSFILDYIVLAFDPDYSLAAMSLPIVFKDGEPINSDQAGYRDALVEQIGKIVEATSETNRELTVVLDEHLKFVIRLDADEPPGPEMAQMSGGGHFLLAWVRPSG